MGRGAGLTSNLEICISHGVEEGMGRGGAAACVDANRSKVDNFKSFPAIFNFGFPGFSKGGKIIFLSAFWINWTAYAKESKEIF